MPINENMIGNLLKQFINEVIGDTNKKSKILHALRL